MTNLTFPLTLSCGCKALSNCRCWSERGNSGRVDGDSPIDRVLREFNGAWRQTLENYGCHLPSGRHHGPCPVCGGKDRFRFDDKVALVHFLNQINQGLSEVHLKEPGKKKRKAGAGRAA